MENQASLLKIAQIGTKAALEAGDFFFSKITAVKAIKTKSSPSDLVTDVDPECERMIREQILTAFPTHQILGEESTAPGSAASVAAAAAVQDAAELWIVDPLDGTTNFVYEVPLSVVSIAYAEQGVVQMGVIYDPYRREVFLAIRELGGWLLSADAAQEWSESMDMPVPGRQLFASNRETLAESVVATGFPTRAAAREQTTAAGLRLSSEVKSLRSFGSAAMHLAYVAAGRLDGFWEYDLNAWDLAAGALLVEEAGGVCRDLDGSPYTLAVRNILVSGKPALADAIQVAMYIAE